MYNFAKKKRQMHNCTKNQEADALFHETQEKTQNICIISRKSEKNQDADA
jgi:hypothetical protein